jgi:protein O-GlcNAc transferase
MGRALPGRVAASLLQAVGVPELITDSLADYERRAFELASGRTALGALRDKLVAARDTSPLFDTARFARHLERAFTLMTERARRGDPPAGFAVPALP